MTALVGWKHLPASVRGYFLGKVPESNSSPGEEPADSLQSPCLKIKRTQISDCEMHPPHHQSGPTLKTVLGSSSLRGLHAGSRSRTKESRPPLGSLIYTPFTTCQRVQPLQFVLLSFWSEVMKSLPHPCGQPWANWEGRDSRTWWMGLLGIPNPKVRNAAAFSVKLYARVHSLIWTSVMHYCTKISVKCIRFLFFLSSQHYCYCKIFGGVGNKRRRR